MCTLSLGTPQLAVSALTTSVAISLSSFRKVPLNLHIDFFDYRFYPTDVFSRIFGFQLLGITIDGTGQGNHTIPGNHPNFGCVQ